MYAQSINRTKERIMTTPSIRTNQWPLDVTAPSRSRAASIALWIVQIATAAMFLLAGSSKLAGVPAMVGLFGAIGIGQWFRYLTGSIEVVSAILLLIPSLAFFGALLLVPTMVAAVLTHLFIVGGNPAPAIVLGSAAAGIAWTRRRGR
jgi:putative oxidoreductase